MWLACEVVLLKNKVDYESQFPINSYEKAGQASAGTLVFTLRLNEPRYRFEDTTVFCILLKSKNQVKAKKNRETELYQLSLFHRPISHSLFPISFLSKFILAEI